MNMFYNGSLRTLAPIYRSKYDIEVIRPLIKVREAQTENFARENGFATISDEACPAMKFPVKMPHAREKTKAWLKTMEKEHDDLFKMLKTSFSHLHAETFFDPRFHTPSQTATDEVE
jgi:tRNA(Ile)-lysidine synthase TilS/MesJ